MHFNNLSHDCTSINFNWKFCFTRWTCFLLPCCFLMVVVDVLRTHDFFLKQLNLPPTSEALLIGQKNMQEHDVKVTNDNNSTNINAEKEKSKDNRLRSACFCVGHSRFWKAPIHRVTKKIKARCKDATWLRMSMSCHRHANLGELLQGDPSKKTMNGIESVDFTEKKCGCWHRHRRDAACAFDRCNAENIMHEHTWKLCDSIHVGQTAQKVKKRAEQHRSEAIKFVSLGESSDAWAEHCGACCKNNNVPLNHDELRKHVDAKTLWQGKWF